MKPTLLLTQTKLQARVPKQQPQYLIVGAFSIFRGLRCLGMPTCKADHDVGVKESSGP